MITHVPKGSMCASCAKIDSRKCRELRFESMPVIKKHPDGVVTVKCSEFVLVGKAKSQ